MINSLLTLSGACRIDEMVFNKDLGVKKLSFKRNNAFVTIPRHIKYEQLFNCNDRDQFAVVPLRSTDQHTHQVKEIRIGFV